MDGTLQPNFGAAHAANGRNILGMAALALKASQKAPDGKATLTIA